MPWLIVMIVLFVAVPIISLIELIVDFIRYRRAPKEAVELRQNCKHRMIVSGVLLGVVAAVWICLMILFAQAITYM